jgi:hypothetical protein
VGSGERLDFRQAVSRLNLEVAGVADYALFVGWGSLVRGRETQAVKVFGESVQYYAELQQKGIIESFEPFLLEPHGGDLNGFILIRGDKDKLAHLRADAEFERRTLRASTIVDSVGVIMAYTGGRVAELMGSFEKDIADLR